jgi:hypothetical protein
VVRADTGGDVDLEPLGLVNLLLVDVAGVEGGGDNYVGVDNLLVENGVGCPSKSW